ncbi:EAL domain-containing protein [Euzebya sp.]|uniref:EAL domain-containing protein n=1 Tax=Euzebya sp. TaxID=1971409 RepID=UPI003511862F
MSRPVPGEEVSALPEIGVLRPKDPAVPPDTGRRRIGATALPYSRARHFDRILETRAVDPQYQPIVDLGTREVVAYEALSRGPKGTPLERPDLLFGTARDMGMVRELDWVCRARAMEGAIRAGMGSDLTLFVNVEPDVAATRAPDDLILIMKQAEQDLRVVLEVTERALLQRPAELLHWLSWARERWWGVALDDVGADPASLALMPFVNPDVIKLDFVYVRKEVLDDDDLRMISAVREHADRTGATILAEGIETAAHVERARELGASLGQGWYFGRPSALPSRLPSPRRAVPLLPASEPVDASSPWDIVEPVAEERQSLGEARARRIFARVEQSALLSREAPVVLGCFPPAPGPWGHPDRHFEKISDRAAFCGAIGVDMANRVRPGWQSASLTRGEEMADEWCVVVIGAHHAEVAVAFDAGEVDADGHRLLDVITTRDRRAVSRVAELLMRKLAMPAVGVDGRLVERVV